MVNAFIIHGAYGSPTENWFSWLKEKLEKENVPVSVPKFPTPINQTLDRWMEVFNKYEPLINSDSIVIGHSLGVAFLLNVLEKYQIKSAFFVAGVGGKVDNEFWEDMKSFADKSFDWAKIRSNCEHFYIYHSDNDPYIPLSHAKILAKNLNSKLKIIPDSGHFNESSGYKKFEILLRDIKKTIAKHL